MKHALTFRGQDHEVPAGFGLCTRCGALMAIEEWLEQDCARGDAPDRRPRPGPQAACDAMTPCQCPEHRCLPDRAQTDRYPIAGGYQLCARCYALGHGAPLRLRYAGLLP